MKICISIYVRQQHIGYPNAEKVRQKASYASVRKLASVININQVDAEKETVDSPVEDRTPVRNSITYRRFMEIDTKESKNELQAILDRWEMSVDNNNRQFRVKRQEYKDLLAQTISSLGYSGKQLRDIPDSDSVRVRRLVKQASFHYWKAQMIITKSNDDDTDQDFGTIKSRYGMFLSVVNPPKGFVDTKAEGSGSGDSES